jgi:hypothetical protein
MSDTAADLRASQQVAENQQREREAEQQRQHDRLIESDQVAHNGGGIDREGMTDFISYSVNGLRKMILDSKPGDVSEVGTHWKSVHNVLSGGDGDGKTGGVDAVSAKDSVAGALQTAVDNVMEYWEGEAAEAFRRRAGEIATQIRNGAAYANFTAEQLFAISKDLDAAKTKMEDIKEPSLAERASDRLNDDGRDDTQMRRDYAAGASAETVAQANEKNLSLQMERRLQAVAVMEELAVNYKVYTGNLNKAKPVNDRETVSPPNSDVTMPPPISVPSASASGPSTAGSGSKTWSAGPTNSVKAAPTTPRDVGITGGSHLPATRTNMDSISSGLTGTNPNRASVGVSGGGGSSGGGAQAPGVVSPGGMTGLGRGSAARGGVGATGVRGGVAGGVAGGRSTGVRAGTGGAGVGGVGRGGAGASGRGALAKSRGGIVGATKGVTGNGAGGGAGLHGSRGGTQRGALSGAAGGPGGRKGRRPEDENSQGERPDYLIEDEETWISEEDRNRNVPRTIE